MKIVFDRNKCIGAFACVGEQPECWKPASDGKVDLDGAKKTGDGKFELEIDEKDAEKSRAAAASCPVAAIEIVE